MYRYGFIGKRIEKIKKRLNADLNLHIWYQYLTINKFSGGGLGEGASCELESPSEQHGHFWSGNSWGI